MTEPRHYETLLRRPTEGSLYAYFVRAAWILSGYRDLPMWVSLGDPPGDLDKRQSRLHAAYKRQSDNNFRMIERVATQKVMRAGHTRDDLQKPEVQEMIRTIVDGSRAELKLWEGGPFPIVDPVHVEDDGNYPREMCQDVIFGASQLYPKLGFAELAGCLNEGATKDNGLEPDHVRRALGAFYKRHAKSPGARRFGIAAPLLDCHAVSQRFVVLERIREAAQAHPDYRKYKGAALADRIDADVGLFPSAENVRASSEIERRDALFYNDWSKTHQRQFLERAGL